MNVLFDRDGNEVIVPHAIDRKERVATGELFIEKPKPKAKRKTTPKKD